MNDLNLSITAEPVGSPDARRLIAALDAALAELYPPAQRFGQNLRPEHLEDGRGTFLVVRDVEPDHRGKGVGRTLLASLQAAASELGVQRLVLESGVHQAAAISLYRGSGFTQIDCWGEYASSATSICFQKNL